MEEYGVLAFQMYAQWFASLHNKEGAKKKAAESLTKLLDCDLAYATRTVNYAVEHPELFRRNY